MFYDAYWDIIYLWSKEKLVCSTYTNTCNYLESWTETSNLSIFKARSTLAPVRKHGQLIACRSVSQKDPRIDRIIISGHGLRHAQVPRGASIPERITIFY